MLELLKDCLGGDWINDVPLGAKVEKCVQKDGYRLERVSYLVEKRERIYAYLLIPDKVSKTNKAPGICVWHQHKGAYDIGKEEPAGLKGDPMHHTGVALAKEGYVVLCPDAIGFGERNKRGRLSGKSLEHYLFSMLVVEGKCLAWKNILDMKKAIDYLCSRDEVDSNRIGCYGHSMGSTFSWLLGPFDPRLKAIVGNCCMPTYSAMERTDLIHCFSNYIPRWRQYGDIADIAGLCAPTPLHLNFGEKDEGSPMEEVISGVQTIQKYYADKNVADNFSYYVEKNVGHILSDNMWKKTKVHFKKFL